jgi:hypothetical protein
VRSVRRGVTDCATPRILHDATSAQLSPARIFIHQYAQGAQPQQGLNNRVCLLGSVLECDKPGHPSGKQTSSRTTFAMNNPGGRSGTSIVIIQATQRLGQKTTRNCACKFANRAHTFQHARGQEKGIAHSMVWGSLINQPLRL